MRCSLRSGSSNKYTSQAGNAEPCTRHGQHDRTRGGTVDAPRVGKALFNPGRTRVTVTHPGDTGQVFSVRVKRRLLHERLHPAAVATLENSPGALGGRRHGARAAGRGAGSEQRLCLGGAETGVPRPHFGVPLRGAYFFGWQMEKLNLLLPGDPFLTSHRIPGQRRLVRAQ